VLTGLAGGLSAQVTLALTQTPNVFPSPGSADYSAGMITEPGGIVFTVNSFGPANIVRTTTLFVRASSADLGGGKSLSDLEWRRADLTTWNAMTTADVLVESRPVQKNQLNDPWSNTLFLRMHLNWVTDPPATYSAGIVFTLTVTTP
jgi:hypothetical protein